MLREEGNGVLIELYNSKTVTTLEAMSELRRNLVHVNKLASGIKARSNLGAVMLNTLKHCLDSFRETIKPVALKHLIRDCGIYIYKYK